MSSNDDDAGNSSPPVINTEELASSSCDVCRLGSGRPALTPPPRVQVPPSSSRVSSVQRLVADANVLAADNRALRARIDETTALNAGLAAHASVLHDRNLALLRRSREGFDIGLAAFDRLQRRVEELESENTRLDELAARLQTAASQSRHWETRFRVLEASSYEDACTAQDTLAAAQSHAAGLELQLAAGNAHISDLASQLVTERARVVQLRTQLALSVSPPIVPVVTSSQVDASHDRLDDVPGGSATARAALSAAQDASADLQAQLAIASRERDDAIRDSEGLGRQCVVLRGEVRALRDELGRSRAEKESARQLNEPLEDDLRRVNALLTAYAEERQRDLDRTRDLEASVSAAEAARVAAHADQARSQAAETQAVARSDQYRRGWLDIRRSAEQARETGNARVHRLSTRVADLEGELDRARRDLDDRAAAWRRLLCEARRGRETARRVNTALSARLVAVVDAAGGTIAVDDLVRSIEATVGPAVASAVPLPPNNPDLAREGGDCTPPASPAPASPLPSPRRSPGPSSPPSPPSSPAAASLGGPRPGTPSHSQGGGSTHGGGPTPGLGTPSPRRSSRSSTAGDTAASASAATQRQRPGSMLSDSSSDSVARAHSRRTKRRRLRRHASRSSSSTRTSPTSRGSRSGSASRARSASPERSVSPAPSNGSWGSPRSQAEESSGDGDSSSSSSTGSSSSDSAADAAPAPFFSPVIPPASDRHVWSRRITAPWPRSLRRLRLTTISARQVRPRLPPSAWIYPAVPASEPPSWDAALVTRANVDALYATRPWRYLTQLVPCLTFAAGDTSFARFVARYRVHLEHWAQAYWESSHELVVSGSEWDVWRRQRNSRRSHAGDHFASVLQLIEKLFHRRLADMDLFLDPMVLHFSPSRSDAGRWYPDAQHATLQEALDAVDAQEPWRRFFRSPLTVAGMDTGVQCTVTRAHPAFSVPRLENKFIQEI